jgi:hypothetical protein
VLEMSNSPCMIDNTRITNKDPEDTVSSMTEQQLNKLLWSQQMCDSRTTESLKSRLDYRGGSSHSMIPMHLQFLIANGARLRRPRHYR